MHPSFIHRFPAALRGAAFAMLLTVAAAPLLRAQIYTEVGDAGQTQAGAQNSGLTQPGPNGNAAIFGTIGTPNDADLFRITITNVGTFAASTVNLLTGASGGAGGLDTQLFLFDSLFRPVVMNDDAAGGATLQSRIPQGSIFLTNLSPGVYYIGISLAGVDPVNSANQLLFASNGGDPTSLRGMASGLNPNTLFDFNGSASFAQSGAYQINIFTVPETGSTLVLLGAAVGVIVMLRRRSAVKVAVRN